MSRHESFFTKNQNRLLNIAGLANFVAWVVIVIYSIAAFSEFIQGQYAYSYQFQRQAIFSEIVKEYPLFALNIIANTASVLVKGIVYFLLLKAISLGLYMIVETDINYREQDEEEKKL